MRARILVGDVMRRLADIPDNHIHCVVTSPPYWGLRDYGTASWEGGSADCDHKQEAPRFNGSKQTIAQVSGHASKAEAHDRTHCHKCGAARKDAQIGLERAPSEYVRCMVEIFREIRRVLRPDGTAWLNLGDSFCTGAGSVGLRPGGGVQGDRWSGGVGPMTQPNRMPIPGLKPKDLCGIPWRVAFALQEDGWWLRSDVIWSKKNSMPESVLDRPTKSHEYLFLLAKSERYFYDSFAIREPLSDASVARLSQPTFETQHGGSRDYAASGVNSNRSARKSLENLRSRSMADDGEVDAEAGRAKRSVWTTTLRPFAWEMCGNCGEHYPDGAETDGKCNKCGEKAWVSHFATFPEELITPCILAGTSEMGCCPTCGKPLDRVIETVGGNVSDEAGIAAMLAKGVPRTTANLYVTKDRGQKATAGWRRACSCDPSGLLPDDLDMFEPVPCRVLDPFCGAGTTGVVALRHHRDFVGIELNPNYASIAEHRIRLDQPMFNQVDAEADCVEESAMTAKECQ